MARSTAAGALALAALLAACGPEGTERMLAIDATGAVIGVVYLDRDGNLQLTPGLDGPAPGVRVSLLRRGTRDTVAAGTSDAAGAFLFDAVPVGDYRVVVDTATVGDSLRVARVDTADITVAASDTLGVLVAVGYRPVSIVEARRLPTGSRAFVEGIALNGWATFGDATLHLADGSGAIRATNVQQAAVQPGDSVRLVGSLAILDGQPVLTSSVVFRVGTAAQPPQPEPVSTTAARTADNGRLDAALVRIAGAVILDAATTVGGDRLLRVDDGSGALEVLIDRNAPITAGLLVPQAILDATGVLVPAPPGGSWVLKPRSDADVSVRFDSVTIAQARALPPGKLVAIIGIALNGRDTFGDASVHLYDATGAIRATNVGSATPVFAGDSVRLIGTMRVRDGQPVLDAATPERRAADVGLPAPHDLTVAEAATASCGAHDAALVRVQDVRITQNNGAGTLLVVPDAGGSDQLEVRLEPTAVPSCPHCSVGSVVDITGVLVPVAGQMRWVLKPRSPADIVQ